MRKPRSVQSMAPDHTRSGCRNKYPALDGHATGPVRRAASRREPTCPASVGDARTRHAARRLPLPTIESTSAVSSLFHHVHAHLAAVSISGRRPMMAPASASTTRKTSIRQRPGRLAAADRQHVAVDADHPRVGAPAGANACGRDGAAAPAAARRLHQDQALPAAPPEPNPPWNRHASPRSSSRTCAGTSSTNGRNTCCRASRVIWPVVFIEEPVHRARTSLRPGALRARRASRSGGRASAAMRPVSTTTTPGAAAACIRERCAERDRRLLGLVLHADGDALLGAPRAAPHGLRLHGRALRCSGTRRARWSSARTCSSRSADLVFTGGPSLYEAKRDRHPACLPSRAASTRALRAGASADRPSSVRRCKAHPAPAPRLLRRHRRAHRPRPARRHRRRRAGAGTS